MIVVDASVLVAALVGRGDDAAWAAARLSDESLAAPAHAPFEAGNVLRRLEAASSISTTTATLAHVDLTDLAIDLFPYEAVAGRAWALRRNATTYDAAYLALAEAIDVPLVTLDRRLAATPGTTATVTTPPRR